MLTIQQLVNELEEARATADKKHASFINDCIRMLDAYGPADLVALRDRQRKFAEANVKTFTERQVMNYQYQDRVLCYIINDGGVLNG